LRASWALARKFPESESFGFVAGERNRLTILDVDANDESILVDALDRHGHTKIVARTAGGGFHAWYRHNGEGRWVRPESNRPIDVLGAGLVVAPPSRSCRGYYEFIQGRLEDLDIAHLPVLKGVCVARDLPREKIGQGHRNTSLWRHCMRHAPRCDDFESLLDVARTFNGERMVEALSDAEVVKTAASAWEYTVAGKNYFNAPVTALRHEEIDALAFRNPDAFALLAYLRRCHWNRRTFALTKAFAQQIGWWDRRLRAATRSLVEFGIIECINPGGRGPHDPPQYRWATR
jgi:Bifunctional DNA primase/polymerase, N-terminal